MLCISLFHTPLLKLVNDSCLFRYSYALSIFCQKGSPSQTTFPNRYSISLGLAHQDCSCVSWNRNKGDSNSCSYDTESLSALP